MTNKKTLQFILTHQNDDVNKLVLKKRTDIEIDYDFAFKQIAGRQRVKHKLPSFYSNKELIYPLQLNIEQCSSESTALYKKSLCEGISMADLTGGFGIDFYYISNNYREAFYIEQNTELCEIVNHNFKILGSRNHKIINKKAEDAIDNLPELDLVYIDPARRNKTGSKTVFISDCEPDISILREAILQKSRMLMVKLSPMLDISSAIKILKNVHEVHIISVANECKEILFILKKEKVDRIKFKAVNIVNNNKTDVFEFFKEDESACIISNSQEIQQFLYEPNSSILKSGAFKSICLQFNLLKLHNNTHLYTSNNLVSDFQGRIFEVVDLVGNSKKVMIEIKIKYPKANISTRNYPLKPEELKRKLGIDDGGDIFIFACTIEKDLKVLIICRKA
jgi:16S rRNA G966 N2-methylase RsmD